MLFLPVVFVVVLSVRGVASIVLTVAPCVVLVVCLCGVCWLGGFVFWLCPSSSLVVLHIRVVCGIVVRGRVFGKWFRGSVFRVPRFRCECASGVRR